VCLRDLRRWDQTDTNRATRTGLPGESRGGPHDPDRRLTGVKSVTLPPVPDEYLTVAELAVRLTLTPKTVRNRMYDGTWHRGVEWFSRSGIGPRFKWSAIVRWLETPERPGAAGAAFAPDILPARRVG